MADNNEPPKVFNQEELKAELLEEQESISISSETAEELKEKANSLVLELVSGAADEEGLARGRASVEGLAIKLHSEAATHSRRLQEPIRQMMDRSSDGGEIGRSLLGLREHIEALDPAALATDNGGWRRVFQKLPFIGSPLSRYIGRYQSTKTIIDDLVSSLETGKGQLRRDEITLTEDQKNLRELNVRLTKALSLASMIDSGLTQEIETLRPSDPTRVDAIEQNLLFPLRQRVMDLQQQIIVNQQGILAMEVVMRNNRELAKCTSRAINVTVSSLRVAVTVALALSEQKKVAEKVAVLNTTTSDVIAKTAEQLKTSGTNIHKQAAQAQLDITKLQQAFADIKIALSEVESFRRSALPAMAQSIIDMDKLCKEAEVSLDRYSKSTHGSDIIEIEILPAEDKG